MRCLAEVIHTRWPSRIGWKLPNSEINYTGYYLYFSDSTNSVRYLSIEIFSHLYGRPGVVHSWSSFSVGLMFSAEASSAIENRSWCSYINGRNGLSCSGLPNLESFRGSVWMLLITVGVSAVWAVTICASIYTFFAWEVSHVNVKEALQWSIHAVQQIGEMFVCPCRIG